MATLPKVRIVTGSGSGVRRFLCAQGAEAIVLDPLPDAPIPWGAARQLLAMLRQRRSDEEVSAAIAPRRAALSLVLRKLEPQLSEDDRQARLDLRAEVLGFLSHNGAISERLSLAWLDTIAALCGPERRIVVPSANRLDEQSIWLLRSLPLRLDAAPELHFGLDAELPAPEGLWRRSQAVLLGHLAAMEAFPSTEVIELPAAMSGATGEAPTLPAPIDPLDDRLEARAYEALAQGSDRLDEENVAMVLDAIRAAFASFGFTAALRLGLDLLRRDPLLSDLQRAELHLLCGLAAYNRQVRSLGDGELADFLEEHFSRALALERDPAQRSHLLYRLLINQGRRKGDLEGSLRIANEAVEAARDPAIGAGLSAFLEAWCRNGRAYVLARMRRLPEAVEDIERAVTLLDEAVRSDEVPRTEARVSRLVIADNRAELAIRSGDRAWARRCQEEMARLERDTFGDSYLASWRTIVLDRDDRDLLAAKEQATRGLEGARRALDPLREDAFAAQLGELQYRLGEATEALESFSAALVVRKRVATPADVVATRLNRALAAFRAGELAEAGQELSEIQETPLCEEPTALAEVLATRALVAAHAGDAERCEAWTNQAIGVAAEAGHRDTLVRVARVAGDACLALGRPDDAAVAFGRALEIAETGAEESPAPPAEIVAALVGCVEAGGDPRLLRRALPLLGDALEDAETWWCIRRFLDLLPRELNADERGFLRPVVAAASQRADSRSLAERWGAKLDATPP